MAINSLHPVTVVQLPLWAVLSYLKYHDVSTTCTHPKTEIPLNTATLGTKLPLSKYWVFFVVGVAFLASLLYRIFQLRGTYNNHLVQQPDQFWTDQVKARFKGIVQTPLQH